MSKLNSGFEEFYIHSKDFEHLLDQRDISWQELPSEYEFRHIEKSNRRKRISEKVKSIFGKKKRYMLQTA